jgi:CRP-like cAMP-binding protein
VAADTQQSAPADSSFYGLLTEAEREELRARGIERAYRHGALIASRPGSANSVMVLVQGWAKACVISSAGETVLLRVYGRGDLIGGEALGAQQFHLETVNAVGHCACLVLPKDHFENQVSRSPGIARAFGLAMLQRAAAADRRTVARLAADAGERLAGLLTELGDRLGLTTDGKAIYLYELTQDDLAGLAGVSRSTATRELRRLRWAGLVWTGYRRIVIPDMDKLREAAGFRPSYALP